jgi:DNA-binding CsgD family transcriptional regulator
MARIEFPVLQSFSEQCLAATTTGEITRAFDAILKAQGIMQWYVGNLGFVNEWRGFGFDEIPSAWRKRYVEADHARYDPVFQHAVNHGGKTTWAECRRVTELLGDKRALQVFNESDEYGLNSGLILPIQGLGDLPAAVSFGGTDLDLSDDAQASFFVIGALAYESLRRLVVRFKPIPPILTERELEVLRWAAEGKSAVDTGAIIGISVFTVQDHQKSLRAKYCCTKMTQVLVLAALDGTLMIARSLKSA